MPHLIKELIITKEPMHYTAVEPEKALIVGIDRGSKSWPLTYSLDELERLVDTAGAQVVQRISQRMDAPNARSFIGKGKVEELASAVSAFAIDVVVFDDELTPTQQANLERELGRSRKGIKIIDRTALILDIFALHATTKEGRYQVKLAQNIYLLPRLRGMWEHLASGRMGGGVGSRFGEGESQLEVDRRMVRDRITNIKQRLKKIEKERATQRKSRNASGLYKVAIAGYTNAGKSTLLNAMTGAEVLAYDKLFATLDSTTRRLALKDGREITLSDTVGFIQKLPTTLIEAFKSTLEEVVEADLILHVVDASDPQAQAQIQTVIDVLEQIGAHNLPSLLVFNKGDLLDAEQGVSIISHHPQALIVSAQANQGIEELLVRVEQTANAASVLVDVVVPFDKGALVKLAHEQGTIIAEDYIADGTHLQVRLPKALAAKFEALI